MGAKMTFIINDEKWASSFQQDLEEYMMVLQDSLDEDEDVETLSGEPYCGCSDCYWREILFFASPKLMMAQNEGKIELDGTGPQG